MFALGADKKEAMDAQRAAAKKQEEEQKRLQVFENVWNAVSFLCYCGAVRAAYAYSNAE